MTGPDLVDMIQRLSQELRDLAARVGRLEQRMEGQQIPRTKP